MPWSALPEHIDEHDEWHNTDWDWWGQRWMLKIKGWFAYGPRATEKWAKWRPIPKDLININATRTERLKDFESHEWLTYTSVIQYWTRWHFLLQWPFHVSFHVYYKLSTIPVEPDRRDFGITEMFYIRFGARFDNDQVFWAPSIFIGGDWN